MRIGAVFLALGQSAQRVAEDRVSIHQRIVQPPVSCFVVVQYLVHPSPVAARLVAFFEDVVHAYPLGCTFLPIDNLVQPRHCVDLGEFNHRRGLRDFFEASPSPVGVANSTQAVDLIEKLLDVVRFGIQPARALLLDVQRFRFDLQCVESIHNVVEAIQTARESAHQRTLVGLQGVGGQPRVYEVLLELVESKVVGAGRGVPLTRRVESAVVIHVVNSFEVALHYFL